MTRLFIMLVAIAVLGGLALFLRFTRAGLLVRAVNQDRSTASAMGVNARMLDAFIFGLGVAFSGMAGWVLASMGLFTPITVTTHPVTTYLLSVSACLLVGSAWREGR